MLCFDYFWVLYKLTSYDKKKSWTKPKRVLVTKFICSDIKGQWHSWWVYTLDVKP